jgi:uncharacterized membrane protein HdeD (DUF308 family)
MPAQSKNGTLAVYLGIVQFFFATTWTLYVIYLPQLAAQARGCVHRGDRLRPHRAREGRMLGTLFAVLALAAFARIAAYASDLVVQPQLKALLPWLPEAAWLLSVALLFLAARAFRRE